MFIYRYKSLHQFSASYEQLTEFFFFYILGEYFINTSFSLSSKTIGPTQHYCVSLDPLQDYHMKKVQCTDEYQFLCGKRL